MKKSIRVTVMMVMMVAMMAANITAMAASEVHYVMDAIDANNFEAVLVVDYDISTEDYAEVLSYYNEVPEVYQQKLEEYGWSVRLTDMSMDEAGEYDKQVLLSRYPNAVVKTVKHTANTTGITKYATRTIYINKAITDSFGEGVTEQTVLHEIGHAVDRILYYEATGTELTSVSVNQNYSDYDQGFESIYATESVNARGYAQSSSREYFADSFADYIMDNAAMAAEFPQTYAFVSNALATLQ